MPDLPESFSPYKEQCQCGHDRVSHFDKKHTCLGMFCDCTQYLKPGEAPPASAPVAPPPAPYTNDADDDDGGPLTPRLPFTWP